MSVFVKLDREGCFFMTPVEPAVSDNEAVIIVRTLLEKVRSAVEPSLAATLMAPKVLAHQVESEGHTPSKGRLSSTRLTSPRCSPHMAGTPTIDELFGSGDRVYARWTQVGRHVGDVEGFAPTGRVITEIASAVYRVHNGVIAEYWMQTDRQGLRTQLKAGSESH